MEGLEGEMKYVQWLFTKEVCKYTSKGSEFEVFF